ncbi:protein kinase [Chloroflexia bacterium SDU3-3]|nr:protein kinase [Chloroflexia bacterium SDU3-3]
MLKDQITTLGGYELEELIDHGEIGDTYRAFSASFERPVLLTLLHESLAQDPSFRASFRFQGAAVRALRNPYCTEVIDTGIYDASCFVAMEQLEHGTLSGMLDDGSAFRLAPAARVGIIWQVAKALEYAHNQGFVHGSLTPHSIFIAQNGDVPRIKVSDFGVAWLALHSDGASNLWSDSLTYAMAPERCQGVELDERVDIYALGSLLYTLLCGQPPFQVSTVDAAVFRHVYTQPLPPRQLNDQIPEVLEQVALRCLAKSPADRFAAMVDVANALAPFIPPELLASPIRVPRPGLGGAALGTAGFGAAGLAVLSSEQTQALSGQTQALAEQTQALDATSGAAAEETQALSGQTQALAEQTQSLDATSGATAEQTQALSEQTQALEAQDAQPDVGSDRSDSGDDTLPGSAAAVSVSDETVLDELPHDTDVQAAAHGAAAPDLVAETVDLASDAGQPPSATGSTVALAAGMSALPSAAAAGAAALDFTLPDRKPLVRRAPMELVGKTIAGYKLETYMGESETGDVYRALHIENDTVAAMKIISDDLAYEPFFAANFAEQADSLKVLKHPNIISVLDAGRVDDLCYVVMEWLPDGTLRNLLQRRGAAAIPLRQGLDLVRQAAVGLEYIHAQHLIHGSVKPANLMLVQYQNQSDTDYTLKISDAGFAWVALRTMSEEQIWPDSLIYAMPPERCQGLELDHRADIYALGVILYELTTGSPPFEAKSLEAAIYRHVYTPPTPPRQLVPTLPPTLEAIILQCLAKRPADRFPTMSVLADHLTALLNSPSFAPRVQARPKAVRAAATASAPAISGPFVPQVSVLDQYGRSVKTADLTGEGMRIGRAPNSDIVLSDPTMAPLHVQVDWDGSAAVVSNMSQQNNVLVGNAPLAPEQSTQWNWDSPIRLGSYWLRLEAVSLEKVAPATATPNLIVDDGLRAAAPAVAAKAAAVVSSTDESLSYRIGIALDQDTLVLTPGKPGTFRMTLSNMGNTVDHFTVTVEGVSPKWIVGDPPMVQLNPGVQATVSLNILVPAVPEYEAGDYPVNIRVRSRENPLESNIAPALWTLLPFLGSTFDMRPKRVKRRYKGRYRISIRNTGNTTTKFALSATDDEEALNYQFAHDVIEIKPGMVAKTDLYAWPLRRRWYGQSITHRFNVHMKTVGTDLEPLSTPAQLEQLAMISRWWVGALALLLLAFAVLLWLHSRPYIDVLETAPDRPLQNEPFMLNWRTRNSPILELKINNTPVAVQAGSIGLPFRGAGAPAQVQLVARNYMLGYAEKSLLIRPVVPTPTPSQTPTEAPTPTATIPPTLTPTIPPTPTLVPPTPTPTPVPSPTSQTLCMAGSTSDLVVTGRKRESYLVNFDGRVISGGQLDDRGFGIIHLGPFHELPGTYKVEVRSRITGRLLLGVTCIVP